MMKMKKDKKIAIKVIDVTGKLDDYVTLEEFMNRTAFIEDRHSDEE